MYSLLRLVSVLLLALTSTAAPLVAGKRGVQAALLRELRLMEQYASAAYCAVNTDSPGDGIRCASGNCPLVQEAGVVSVDEADVEAYRWYFGRVYACEDRVKRAVREWEVVGWF